jgi:hypothetical protein
MRTIPTSQNGSCDITSNRPLFNRRTDEGIDLGKLPK